MAVALNPGAKLRVNIVKNVYYKQFMKRIFFLYFSYWYSRFHIICEFQHKIPKYGVNISLGILCIYVYEACFLQLYLKAISQYSEVLIFIANQSCAFHVISSFLVQQNKAMPYEKLSCIYFLYSTQNIRHMNHKNLNLIKLSVPTASSASSTNTSVIVLNISLLRNSPS